MNIVPRQPDDMAPAVPEGAPLRFLVEEPVSWPTSGARRVQCPLCQDTFVHCEGAYEVSGYDNYCAWEGRSGVVRVQWWCEQGHAWEVCFGFHKGETGCFLEQVPVVRDEDHAAWPYRSLQEARVRAETRAATRAEVHAEIQARARATAMLRDTRRA